MVAKELQVFLIWDKGRVKEQEIIADIANKYQILQVFEISWNPKYFPANITRFYNKNMRGGYSKTKQSGTGKFLFLICFDNQPAYQYVAERNIEVNTNAILNKSAYRQWTGGGFLVHASDNYNEVEENLLFMLGMNNQEVLTQFNQPWNGEYLPFDKNMPGSPEWKNMEQLFNFAAKISNLSLKLENGVLIVSAKNQKQAKRLLNLHKPLFSFKKNQYKTRVGGKNIKVILRQI